MSNRHWTQKAARALQDEARIVYTNALRFVRENEEEIRKRALAADEDDLGWKARTCVQAIALYQERQTS